MTVGYRKITKLMATATFIVQGHQLVILLFSSCERLQGVVAL